MASFLANGVVTNVVLTPEEISKWYRPESSYSESFSVARIRVQGLYFCQSPSTEFPSLCFGEYYPPCSPPWEHQPIHNSKRNMVTQAHYVTLETFSTLEEQEMFNKPGASRRACIQIDNPVLRATMATTCGSPLLDVPIPEDATRIDIHCHHCISSITAEQLFFMSAVFAYIGRVFFSRTRQAGGSLYIRRRRRRRNCTINNKKKN